MKKLIKKDYFNAIANYLSDNAIEVIGEAKEQVIIYAVVDARQHYVNLI